MSTFEQFIENPENRRLLEQDRLLVEAAEVLHGVMESTGTNRSALAEKLGRSRSFVTQILRGSRNLTLKTLADALCVLNHRVVIHVEPIHGERSEAAPTGGWILWQRSGNSAVSEALPLERDQWGVAA